MGLDKHGKRSGPSTYGKLPVSGLGLPVEKRGLDAQKGGNAINKQPRLAGLAPRRKAAGLTQQRFAEALGVERATVAMWECGRSWPSARLLPDIADVLRCSVDDLYREPTETGEAVKSPIPPPARSIAAEKPGGGGDAAAENGETKR